MVPAFGTNMRSSRICRRNAAFSWLHRSILALVAGFAIPPLTHAQETNWPSKTVTVVVGFGAGGATDVMARMASRKLSEDLKQAFVVEIASEAQVMLLLPTSRARPRMGILYFSLLLRRSLLRQKYRL
jgi:hypothetical protein